MSANGPPNMLGTPSLSDKEFAQIRALVYERAGINLTEQKRALVSGRLSKILRDEGLASFQAFVDRVNDDESGRALSTLIDRISTNHTFFYREPDHFTFFEERLLPELIDRGEADRSRRIRIWIAGCSSGEESALLAMLLHRALGSELPRWDVGILATDISTTALTRAIEAVYKRENVDHLPAPLRKRYIRKEAEDKYQVVDDIRTMITHRRLNLMRPAFPFKGTFQAIFCRNVMIYFDQVTRAGLLDRFAGVLDPEGYLFIGHSESLGRNHPHFHYVMPALYQKSGAGR